MRNSTYWYRTKVKIPQNLSWRDPALFLGAIKERGWIYWDGHFVESVAVDRAPTIVLLSKTQVQAGEHQLAIRVESVGNQNPGIFHAYARKAVLGNFTDLMGEQRSLEQERYENVAIVVVQFAAMLILMLVLLGEKGSNEKHSWLGLYLLSSLACSTNQFFAGNLQTYIEAGSLILLSISLLGYGLDSLALRPELRSLAKRAVSLYGLLVFLAGGFCIWAGPSALGTLNQIEAGVALTPIAVLALGYVHSLSRQAFLASLGATSTEKLTALTLLGAHICVCFEVFLTKYVPVFFHPSLIIAGFTALVAGLAVREYIDRQTILAFYGRFIRSGLKNLLQEHGRQLFLDQKMFRGRRIPIMKIDIVGHTASTFSMPYGVKRLFQDLFFTHVDYAVANQIFLDRSEGDGSIYFFEERASDTPCYGALCAAFKIQEETVASFDHQFKSMLSNLLKETPELRDPMKNFEDRYFNKTGKRFGDRRTRVRVSFVYGFVDEGLWGLTSQSHYGLEGDLMTLLARLEKVAGDDEVLVTSEFAEQVRLEMSGKDLGFEFEARKVTLKGIGDLSVVSVRKRLQGESAA